MSHYSLEDEEDLEIDSAMFQLLLTVIPQKKLKHNFSPERDSRAGREERESLKALPAKHLGADPRQS